MSSASEYVKRFVDSPEMFPRERLQAERILELRLSWAMKKATDEGKIHVRAIAPPLQLTGDPDIDFSLTHNVLLVADDLKPDESFNDVYEVRIGPSPQLATIRPARASDTLAEADKVMAEEQLTRLRLDLQTLKADAKFAETIQPRLSNHVAAATNAAAQTQAKLDLQIQELQPQLTNALLVVSNLMWKVDDGQTNLTKAANASADTNKLWLKARTDLAAAQNALAATNAALADAIESKETNTVTLAKLTNDVAIARTNNDVASANEKTIKNETNTRKRAAVETEAGFGKSLSELTKARADASSIESGIKKLAARKTEIDQDVEALQQRLAAFSRRADAVVASRDAINELVTFWTEMQTKNELLSNYSSYTKDAHPYPMRTALVVTFRAQALKGLSQVTIDVIRRVAEAKPDAKSSAQKAGEERVRGFTVALQELARQVPQLNGLLLAEKNAIEAKSRQTNLKIQGDKLNESIGTLEAQMFLFRQGGSGQPGTELSTNLTQALLVSGGGEVFRPSQARAAAEALHAALTQDLNKDTNGNVLKENYFQALKKAEANLPKHIEQLATTPASITNLNRLNHLLRTLPSERTNLQKHLDKVDQLLPDALRELIAVRQQLNPLQVALQDIHRAAATWPTNYPTVLEKWSNADTHLANLASSLSQAENELRLTQERLPQVPPALATEAEIEQELNRVLKVVHTNLTNLATRLVQGTIPTDGERRETARQLTPLRKTITEATAMAQGLSKARQRVLAILSGNPVQDAPSAPAGSPVGDDVAGRILQGNQAVFRLNVLRGVVSTTAFLLPDDGAAQMFGQGFANQFYAAQVTFRNPNDKPILIYGNTMRLVVRMNASLPSGIDETGEPLRKIWWATWEPLDYDALRRMLEGMQENSWQRYASKGLDLAALGLGFYGVAAEPSKETLRLIAAFAGAAPQLRAMLEADLKRHAANFREKGLNNIEEIPENGTLTRCVFLPKGPIYGSFAFGVAEANEVPFSSKEGLGNPFKPDSRDFGRLALQPAYIHDIRREEVYVEGKRILASDPLTATGVR